ncbi:hypothetical protein JQ760_028500 (plasmid) [Klebsiella pneumoniae]|uniref:hypothetical protein n=1 Tax=Klebsiella pneumoniae TaxID=573 RepID=UPI001FAD0DDD|nr:hypothetical protein [Klebsiella pneumoniae]MCI8108396.1 hypothetical protein [Klebsiella pneumoniae]
MTVQLTKEWLQQEILRLEAGLDREDAYRTDDDGQRTLAAFRLALASIDNQSVEENGIFYPGDAVGVFNIGNETCPDHMVAWTTKGQHLPKGVYWLYLHSPKKNTVEQYDYDELKEALEKIISENWRMHEVLRDLLNKRPGGVYFNKWESVIYEALNSPVTDVWRSRILAEFFPAIIPVEIRDQLIDYCEGTEICDAAAQRIWDIFRSSDFSPDPKCNGGV